MLSNHKIPGFLLALLLSACTSIPHTDNTNIVAIYPDDDPAQDPEMVNFKQDAVDMYIPLGWRQEDINNNGELKLRFAKHDGSRLLVFCFNSETTETDIQKVLQQSIFSAMPDASKTTGVNELDAPGINPKFELYTGTIKTEGVEITMDANIAWRLEDRVDGCRYGVFYAAASKADKRNQYEFLAIARSLK